MSFRNTNIFITGVSFFVSTVLWACPDNSQQAFKPFSDPFFAANDFKVYSGGLRIDGDLLYFNSDIGKWVVIFKDDKERKPVPIDAESFDLEDKTGNFKTGRVELGKPRIAEGGRMIATASFYPNNPQGISPAPVMFFDSQTYDANPPRMQEWGLGYQTIRVGDSAIKLAKPMRMRGIERYENPDGVLELTKNPGTYQGSGCGGVKKVEASDTSVEVPNEKTNDHNSRMI
jgi:hypothetical protein